MVVEQNNNWPQFKDPNIKDPVPSQTPSYHISFKDLTMKLSTAASLLQSRVGARRKGKRKTVENENPYLLPQELYEMNPKGRLLVVQMYQSDEYASCAACCAGNVTGREIPHNQMILDLSKCLGKNSRPGSKEDYTMPLVDDVLNSISMSNTALHGKSEDSPQYIQGYEDEDDPKHSFNGEMAHVNIDLQEERQDIDVCKLPSLLPICNYAVLFVTVIHADKSEGEEDHLIAIRKVGDLLYLLPGEIGGVFMKGTPRAFIWALDGEGREMLRKQLEIPFGDGARIE